MVLKASPCISQAGQALLYTAIKGTIQKVERIRIVSSCNDGPLDLAFQSKVQIGQGEDYIFLNRRFSSIFPRHSFIQHGLYNFISIHVS